MGLSPQTPVVGGTTLQIPAIQSPDFVAGVSGWQVSQDGNVQFNSGTFTGNITATAFQGTNFVINDSGIFFYGV